MSDLNKTASRTEKKTQDFESRASAINGQKQMKTSYLKEAGAGSGPQHQHTELSEKIVMRKRKLKTSRGSNKIITGKTENFDSGDDSLETD